MYYWFLQCVFFCFFQINDLIEVKYVFSHFIYTFFCNEMFMSMMTWMCDWDFQIFWNESLRKYKWKNCKISKHIDSLWNNQLFVVFFLIFMCFIFNFFLFNQLIFHFLCCHVNDGCVDRKHYDAYTTDGFHRALTNSASTRLLSVINKKKVNSFWLFWQTEDS